MKRFLAQLVAASLLAAVIGVVGTSSPASASHPGVAGTGKDVCVGQGTATTSNGLYYPVTNPLNPPTSPAGNPPASAGFVFAFPTGTCASTAPALGGPGAAGTVSPLLGVGPFCGASSGSSDASGVSGHTFSWVGAGSMLVVLGSVVGVVNASPNPLVPGNTCTGGAGATAFLVTGAVALV